ncbi:hypothetical protein HRG_007599 [Hirsutella rhossiliensis]|uniref:Uncharacterized protein n=1 Tax=Hirsutella rhossiliensis TaxID=111463 RepID=A0A9P8SHZ8_9HYPO|nr:uncharacterized protein HRG_07599 [Hirsutella rhossiliensis]KAH0961521.1 hypothetical protein HRG_07599 [Hirsutella rhossiliensis]
MKFTTVLCALPLALATPAPLFLRQISQNPVDVKNLDDFDKKCGKINVKYNDIVTAVRTGVNARRAGETLGPQSYPHPYRNHEDFDFKNGDCKADPNGFRVEFPVAKNDAYDGTNDQSGKIRAIYLYDPNQNVPSGSKPVAEYCGLIYHVKDGFAGCDVRKS